MSPEPSPNFPCPCGSGRKYKHCCGDVKAQRESKSSRTAAVIGVGIMASAAVAGIVVLADFVGNRPPAPAPATTSTPFQIGGATPQPPGPAPEGKVWSPEHGHWHDAPADGSAASPSATVAPVGPPYPQPDGPVPEGKVWSPEHGHWHNDLLAGQSSSPEMAPDISPLLITSPEADLLGEL